MIHLDIRGHKVPALGFGTWRLYGDACTEAVRAALDIGYRHIDTAIRYENEAEVGRAIAASGIDRSELFVTTKLRHTELAAAEIRRGTAESLARLGTGHVDLLLVHWPNPGLPLKETMDALAEMREAGRARLIGVSNYTVEWMRRAVEECDADIGVNQVEYHPFLGQRAVLDWCRTHGIALAAAVPLARGAVDDSPVIREIAAAHGKTTAQVTLRWLVQQDGVAAIPKSGNPARMRENFEIFDFVLADDEMAAISGLANGLRIIDPCWAPDWDAD
jgi:2,5-diketo-D-gluconate reductase B